MAGKQITISERFHLEQVPQKAEELKTFVKENPDYALSAAELLDTEHEGERIYQLSAPIFSVELTGLDLPKRTAVKPAESTSEGKSSQEETEAAEQTEERDREVPEEKEESQEETAETVADSSGTEEDRIGVMANGTQIGWIRDEDRLHMINLYRNYKITGLELSVHGGPYRIVRQDADGGISEDSGNARWSAVLTVYRRVPKSGTVSVPETLTPQQMAASAAFAGLFSGEQMSYGSRLNPGRPGNQYSAPNTAPEPDPSDETERSDSWGIDTTYETVRKEKDPSGRGMVFLLLAAIIATCYLCFSVPGWIPSLGNGASVIEPMGYRIIGLPGYVPGAILALGLLFNISGMFRGGCILPLLAALSYLLSGFTAPEKILFTSVPAVLCILGALCKKKGSTALKWLLALILAAAAAFLLYQHFSGKTYFDPFRGRELTDWKSVTDLFSGKTPETGIPEDDYEYDTDLDGIVYYASEDESDWESDESELWFGEEVFFEDESDYLFWEQVEGETGELIWEYPETETETETETGTGDGYTEG